MSELADKERRAIKILRMYRGDDPIEVSYSGGKEDWKQRLEDYFGINL